MEFAIYFIPSEKKLYDLGSTIIGYDIRNNKNIPIVKGIDPEWVKHNTQYGFHVTLTDAVTIDANKLPSIEQQLQNLLCCFPKDYRFILSKENNAISFWENNPTQAALRFTPNAAVIMLHCILVCELQSQGINSLYLKKLTSKEIPLNWGKDKIMKTKLYKSPYIFDAFIPHFSLINPYAGNEKSAVTNTLEELFNEVNQIEIESLCIVTRENPDALFTIYKELFFY